MRLDELIEKLQELAKETPPEYAVKFRVGEELHDVETIQWEGDGVILS